MTGCSGGSTSGSTPVVKAPTASAGGPYTGKSGVALTFSGSGSSDPQGQALTYAWTFGDSSTGSGVAPTHTYATPGTYTVALTAANTSGLSASASTTATITAQPPVANAGGPYTGKFASPVTFSGALSTDPQGQSLTYAWNFGDNTTGTGVSPTHTYSAIGPFTVTLTVSNTSGVTGSATTTAAIAAIPPVPNAGGTYTGRPTVPVTAFSAAGSTDPQGQALTYAWNFGDGTTGTGVAPPHTYAAAGNYAVMVTATNTSGLSATSTSSAAILAAGQGFAISGTVRTGTTAAAGAHVYLMAANTAGYGQASLPIVISTTTDSVGSYVVAGADSTFAIASGYVCPANAQLYLYSLGKVAAGSTNTATGLMSALGSCNTLGAGLATTVGVNEVSTIAAAYAFSGYATDATHVASSGTPLALTGVANAFANAASLATLSTGAARIANVAGTAVAPQSTVNTLANILYGCSSAATATSCSTLFNSARSGGSTGTTSTDTATVAINLAHNPQANLSTLYGLAGTAFTPALTAVPSSFFLALSFTGGGIAGPEGLAIDALGNVWINNQNNAAITKISPTGTFLSGQLGFTGSGLNYTHGIAIDESGNAWTASDIVNGGALIQISPAGTFLSGTTGFTGNGLNQPNGLGIDGTGRVWAFNAVGDMISIFSTAGAPLFTVKQSAGGAYQVAALAFDSLGDAWTINNAPNAVVTQISSAGVYLSGTSGYLAGSQVPNMGAVALDASNNAWVADIGDVLKLSNSGALLSGLPGYPFKGYADAISLDGLGNVWVGSTETFSGSGSALAELTSSGAVAATFAPVYGVRGVAVDGSGNVWVAGRGDSINGASSVTEIIGGAAPVVTPLVGGIKTRMLATRP